MLPDPGFLTHSNMRIVADHANNGPTEEPVMKIPDAAIGQIFEKDSIASLCSAYS
jgi:hypothetical protein